MGRHRVEAIVPRTPVETFDLWINPVRAPQWQEQLLQVYDVVGGVDVPGATYRMDYGPALKRTVTVLTYRRPEVYRVRAEGSGWRDETTVSFEPDDEGTRVTLDIQLELGWGVIGRIYERWLGSKGIERKLREEMDRFVSFTTRPLVADHPGQLMTVDSGAGIRLVQILAIDEQTVHVRLFPGRAKERTFDVSAFVAAPARPFDPLRLTPLQPSFSSITNIVVAGQPLLALDGGHGIAHFPLTTGAFTDARPEPAGESALPPGALDEVEAWRAVDGPLGGRDLGLGVTTLLSWPIEDQFGVAKILKVEAWGVHARMYSNRWPEPPTEVNPWQLRMDPPWADNPAVAHLPLSLPAYSTWDPSYVRLAILAPSELSDYELWKAAGGRKLGIGDMWQP